LGNRGRQALEAGWQAPRCDTSQRFLACGGINNNSAAVILADDGEGGALRMRAALAAAGEVERQRSVE
jgi:hypothetical protein